MMQENKEPLITPPPGKIFLKFTRQQIDKHMMKGRIIVVNPANPNDFSIERCEIYAVSDSHKFYKPGDKVLIDYNVFVMGKYKQGNMKGNVEVRELLRIGDDSIYWAFDGMDGFNESEIFGRIDEEGFDIIEGQILKVEMTPPMKDQQGKLQPGWILVDPPKTISQSKIIIWEVKDKRDKPTFAKVLGMYSDGNTVRFQSQIKVGEEILIAPNSARPIYFDEKEYGVVKDIYVWAKRSATPAATM